MGKFFIRVFLCWFFVGFLWFFIREFIASDLIRLAGGAISIAIGFYFQLRTIFFNSWEKKLLQSLAADNKKVRRLLTLGGVLQNDNLKKYDVI